MERQRLTRHQADGWPRAHGDLVAGLRAPPNRDWRMMADQDWKLVVDHGETMLFDRGHDPEEYRNVAADHPEIVDTWT
jgi:hypothetical protein